MKGFLVTTTRQFASAIMSEILRVDPKAAISHRREDKTLLLVRSERLSEWSLEAIPGVAHAVSLFRVGLEVRR